MAALYHTDGYRKEVESKIISLFRHEGRDCVQLEDDIFYPHGGGQKGDRGILTIEGNEFKVINTIKDPHGGGDSAMLIETEIPSEFGDSIAKAALDWDFRYAQMKLHTCVHLHHCVLESMLKASIPHPKTSSIEEGFAFNKYDSGTFDIAVLDEVNATFYEIIKKDIMVVTRPDTEKAGYRWWECLGYSIPCGGIHVSNLTEIGSVSISVSSKKGNITVKFILG